MSGRRDSSEYTTNPALIFSMDDEPSSNPLNESSAAIRPSTSGENLLSVSSASLQVDEDLTPMRAPPPAGFRQVLSSDLGPEEVEDTSGSAHDVSISMDAGTQTGFLNCPSCNALLFLDEISDMESGRGSGNVMSSPSYRYNQRFFPTSPYHDHHHHRPYSRSTLPTAIVSPILLQAATSQHIPSASHAVSIPNRRHSLLTTPLSPSIPHSSTSITGVRHHHVPHSMTEVELRVADALREVGDSLRPNVGVVSQSAPGMRWLQQLASGMVHRLSLGTATTTNSGPPPPPTRRASVCVPGRQTGRYQHQPTSSSSSPFGTERITGRVRTTSLTNSNNSSARTSGRFFFFPSSANTSTETAPPPLVVDDEPPLDEVDWADPNSHE